METPVRVPLCCGPCHPTNDNSPALAHFYPGYLFEIKPQRLLA